MLHITNGDSVVGTFRHVKLPGAYLSWSDVLHDGPVPQTATLSELSNVRAQALAGFGWGGQEKIRGEFAARDRALEDFRKHEEVILWFEHDLYDQLQLIQLLDWFSQQDLGSTNLSLIQIDSYPGVKPFYGLGQLTGLQLVRLFPTRSRVTEAQLALARAAWHAFRSPEPAALLELAQQPWVELPFLSAALLRFFQEYPWTTDGLSRTERQVLHAAASGRRKMKDIYFMASKQEECPWSDLSVFLRIARLATGPAPAFEEVKRDAARRAGTLQEKAQEEKTQQDEYVITDHGRELLAGKADWIRLRGGIDTWLGGVHLEGEQPRWRWDKEKKTLVGHEPKANG
ncbi:MAG: DUF1835 domain-containing protein [Candidatus Angelobacter sp.]